MPVKSTISLNFNLLLMLCITCTACLSLGCGNDMVSKASEKPILNESESKAATTSVVAGKQNGADSPAESASELPPNDADPHVVCNKFLKLLQSGNNVTAEKLITRTAIAVIAKSNWELTPIGSPNAKFEMGNVSYATNRQKIAQVDCKMIDNNDGTKTETNMVWMLRRKKEGWRICGMMLPVEGSDQMDFLSFENAQDVELIKNSMADEQTVAENTATAATDKL